MCVLLDRECTVCTFAPCAFLTHSILTVHPSSLSPFLPFSLQRQGQRVSAWFHHILPQFLTFICSYSYFIVRLSYLLQGQRVAVKVMTQAVVDGKFMGSDTLSEESLLHEFQLLSRLSHPNVVHLYGGCLRPPRIFIVEELMVGA